MPSEIYDDLGFNELEFLPLSIRRVLRDNPNIAYPDEFFLHLASKKNRVAMWNNFYANQWASGYVPSVHRFNLNSKTIPTVSKKLVSKIVGNIRIEGEDNEQVGELANSIIDFNNKIMELESYVLDRGEAVTTTNLINFEGQNKVVLVNYPLGRYELKYDVLGNIYEAFLYKQIFSNDNDRFTNYLLVEHRFYRVRNNVKVPFYEYYIVKNMWTDSEYSNIKQYKLKQSDIPNFVKEKIQDIVLDRAIEIGTLGCFRFKNTTINKLAPYSDIGESQFIDIPSFMLSLDTALTYQNFDRYLGRGRVLLPQNGSLAVNGIFKNRLEKKRINNILTDFSFMTPYLDDNGNNTNRAPIEVVQFNIRQQEWQSAIAEAEAKVCVRCGLSVLDYDPTLSAIVRTATEVNYLNDITANTVKEKRSLLKENLDKLLESCILLLQLNVTKAFVVFDPTTIIDKVQNQTLILQQYSQGLISLETAVKQLHPEWKKEEVDAELDRISLERGGTRVDDNFNNILGLGSNS